MTDMSTHALHSPEQPLDLVLRTRQFAMLLNAGIALVRCLSILQQESSGPLTSVWQEVQGEVEQGQTMSRAMGRRSDVFSPFYVAMVRAGEVGGVLDETLNRTADMLEEELEFSRLMGQGVWTPMLMTSAQTTPQDWHDLTEHQQKLTLLLLCRAWSLLLSSGIPITYTLQIAADLLPLTQGQVMRDDVVRELHEGTPLSEALDRLGFLPPFVIELWKGGECLGNVDQTIDKAAQFYRYELKARL